jgi:ABC-2 type transport system ATP-binding protein
MMQQDRGRPAAGVAAPAMATAADGQDDHAGRGDAVLRAVGLTKRYGSATVVDNLHLAVHPGEVFGFLGPNGAGKTTTIAMLLGLVRPSAGQVELFGRPLAPAALSRVGSLVESPTFYPYLSGRDNLRVVARLLGDLPAARIEEVLALVDLDQAAAQPYRTYSLGMKQRLGIAGALLGDPDVLVLDEPTNGLDPAGLVQARALLRDLAARGKAVFLSSHLLHEVEQICDRVVIVRRGVVIARGPVGELLHRGIGSRSFRLLPSDPDRAVAVLRSLPFVGAVRRAEDGRLAIEAPPEQAFALSEALAREGIYLGELTHEEESLEHFFLSLTGSAERGARSAEQPPSR